MDRRVMLAVVAAIAVISAVIGWVAGQRIKSPAEVAAEQEPPPASLITVPIELRTLSQSVVVRGTIEPSDETDLLAPVVAGSTVITRLPMAAGEEVEEGDVLVEVAGRPVIALEGQLPAFRNLIPSLVGPDVRQLEQALVRLDYDPGTVDDTYTVQTAAAVESLYRDRGYQPPESDEAATGTLDAAEADVEAREEAVSVAEDALDAAGGTIPNHERQALDLAVARAEAALTEAQSLAGRIADAERAQSAAASAASSAATRLEQARGGTHPDTGQPPTSDELATLEAENEAAQEALAEADATLAAEEGSLSEPTPELHVRAAEIAVAEARATRTAQLNPPEVADLRDDVDDARAALTDARDALTDARAAVGAWVPTGEVVFFSALPRQINRVLVEVGDEPQGSVMTISGADTIVDSGVSSADRDLVEVGAEALLVDDDLGLSAAAIVTFLAENPGTGDLSDDRYAMQLEPVDPIPEEAMGVNLRVEIPITSSGGEVLTVPLAALSAGADGTARVELERVAGETTLVEVSTGLRASGFVEIASLGEPLSEGDRVVVGRDLVLPGSDAEPIDDDGPATEDSEDGDSEGGDAEDDGSS